MGKPHRTFKNKTFHGSHSLFDKQNLVDEPIRVCYQPQKINMQRLNPLQINRKRERRLFEKSQKETESLGTPTTLVDEPVPCPLNMHRAPAGRAQ